MLTRLRRFPGSAYVVLGFIWFISNLGDRLWLALDKSIPSWDQANHLSYSLRYLTALQTPEFFSGDWWRSFWMLSPKYPPVTYLLSVPFQGAFGVGNDAALLSTLISSAIIIGCVYSLGQHLLSQEVGLWAAAILVMTPRIIHTRLLYLLDTPLLAFTLLSFTCLTFWKDQMKRRGQWGWAIAFGISLGFGLLTKQSILFYLFFPILGLTGWFLWRRQWKRLGQLAVSFLVSVPIWYPWYRTNWIYLFSTAQNSNAIPASIEGDPAVNTLAAWTYYGKDLPLALSWVWLIPPIVGILLACFNQFPHKLLVPRWQAARPGLLWLAFYVGTTYLVCSALYNKDSRYILPYLPGFAILLAFGLTRWCGRWQWVRWVTLSVAILVTVGNLFPIPGSDRITQWFSPDVLFRPAFVQPAPDDQVIESAIAATPNQQVNLGVIPNTDAVNPNTLNYFGAQQQFRAYGRELSSDAQKIQQDYRNFDWFLTKSGDNGKAQPSQLAIANQLATDSDFAVHQQWTLPDTSQLTLYHRRRPRVRVDPMVTAPALPQLVHIDLPAAAPLGVPIPVTYQWQGDRQQLTRGLVLLTWQNTADPSQHWFQDHAIGLGELMPVEQETPPGLQVTENTAMLPAADLTPGEYKLMAQWLDPITQVARPLSFKNSITIRLDNAYPPLPAPPVDYVSQLVTLAQNLRRGPEGLASIFAQVDRFNLYDPPHRYLIQADQSLTYRLSQSPDDPLSLTYAQVLARVLQENPQTAIAALQSLVKLDPGNPYSHAYLAFVYLYDWQGQKGAEALQPALALNPDSEEIQGLKAIAQIMQGQFWSAWQTARPLL